MLSRGHWDSAELLTLGEMAAGWHRACSPTPTPSRGRRETEGLTKSSWRPLPSHSWNFSKMQIPLQSMQTNPQSQGCLPWGPTTTTTTGPTGPPPPSLDAWLGDWSQPESLPASQPDSLSSLGDLGSPLAQVSWRQPGRGAADTGRGPLGREGPFSLGSRALSNLTFGDAVKGHGFQPKALEGGLAPLTGHSAYPTPHHAHFARLLGPASPSGTCLHQPWRTHIRGPGRGSTHAHTQTAS